MSKLMVRIACGLLIMLVVIGGLAGCSSEAEEVGDTTDTSDTIDASEPEYAGPIAEGLLQSLSDGDYETHIAYYAPEVQSSVVEDDFITSTQTMKAAIGDYIDKEHQETTVEEISEVSYIVVYYIAHFTDEPDDVQVAVYFQEIDGEMYVVGCWLNSPKLQASVEQ